MHTNIYVGQCDVSRLLTQALSLQEAGKVCNTIEMTLGRVLGFVLGILFDSSNHCEEDW